MDKLVNDEGAVCQYMEVCAIGVPPVVTLS
jgi:hypothetical protein